MSSDFKYVSELTSLLWRVADLLQDNTEKESEHSHEEETANSEGDYEFKQVHLTVSLVRFQKISSAVVPSR